MKFIFVSLILTSSMVFATSIDLQPGSAIRINASETTDVRCMGSSSSSECILKNCFVNSSLYDVYVGEAKVKSCIGLNEAKSAIKSMQQDGICR